MPSAGARLGDILPQISVRCLIDVSKRSIILHFSKECLTRTPHLSVYKQVSSSTPLATFSKIKYSRFALTVVVQFGLH